MGDTDSSRRVRWAAILLAALAASAVAAATPARGAGSGEFERAYETGLDAYRYGLPLVSIHRTFRIMTSIDRPDGKGDGPRNRFNHVRKLSTPDADTVVAPNEDTLYSIAWLDLRRQPLVMHVPRVRNRYFVLPLMDPYSENFENLGSVEETKPGDYAITGPGQHRVKLPPGVKRIRSRYDRVWIIGRTEVKGAGDVKRVRGIQRRYKLTPLGRFARRGHRTNRPDGSDKEIDRVPMPTGLAYFDNLGKRLSRFPPPRRDQSALDRFAELGIGPGLRPSRDQTLSDEQRRGLAQATIDGPDVVLGDLRTAYLEGFAAHNGWLVSATGSYGADYDARASTAQVGLGALVPSEAIYPLAQVDSSAQPLDGSRRYLVRFEPGELPPAKAFWSLTMYDTDGFFVPNALNHFAIGDRSGLAYGPDGSLEIHLQTEQPANPAQRRNWLPAPPGPFRLIMRLYEPRPRAIDGILDGSGWDPPTVMSLP